MIAHTQVLLARVRQNHVPFYRRPGHTPASKPRPYPGVNCPMLPMSCTRQGYAEVRCTFPLVDPYAGATETLDGFLSGETIPLSFWPS